jgi:two-component system sensor kinase FixL
MKWHTSVLESEPGLGSSGLTIEPPRHLPPVLQQEFAPFPPVEAGLLDLFEEVADLVLILDPAGQVVFANRALREVLGYTPSEIRSRSVYDVTRVEDHAACQAWLAGAAKCSTPPRIRLVFLSQAGKHIPAEGTASARVDGGQVVLLQWVFRDLSNWQRAVASHREREEIFHLLTLHAPIGVFRADATGRITYANELWRRLAGLWHHPQPRGVWWQMVHPEDRPSVLAQWEGSQRQGREFSGEFRVQADGVAARWVRLRLVPAQLSTELESCWIGITEDVSLQREAQTALQRAKEDLESRVQQRTAELAASNDELSQFAYVVTHDLKAPLRGIQQLSEWLSRDHGQELSGEGVRMVGLLNERVQHLQRLIDGLLACARVGRTPEIDSAVPTFDLVQRIIRLLAPPASVAIEVADHLPVINGNRERLQQIFQNLLDNAIKYLDKAEGRVRLDACHLDGAWHFSVADNGPGIPARYQDKIFQIGQRLHGSDGPNGTGLGLALVKRIVENRGGRIWIESVEGEGTTLSFTWPDRPRGRNGSS